MDGVDSMPLFARLLGDAYGTLPEPLRKLHDSPHGTIFRGKATVTRSRGLASLFVAFAPMPSAHDDAPLTVRIEKNAAGEIWRRNFDGESMVSTLSVQDGLLTERLGAVRLFYTLSVDDGAILWNVRKIAVLGVPLPSAPFRGFTAREYVTDGVYAFDVRARLPLIGELIHYRGFLEDGSHD